MIAATLFAGTDIIRVCAGDLRQRHDGRFLDNFSIRASR